MRRDRAEPPTDRAACVVGGPEPEARPEWIHASCVALGEDGVLLLGASGAGKSDLALRLIHDGGVLVADDQVAIERSGEMIIARPAETLRGLIEARGVGILRLPYRPSCRLGLVVQLDAIGPWPRLPEPSRHRLLGIDLPRLHLDPGPASAGAKIRMALMAERVV